MSVIRGRDKQDTGELTRRERRYCMTRPLVEVIAHFAFMGLFQVAVAAPFMLRDARAYVSLAFNFSRQFEHRVNLAWGFLGDDVRRSPAFGKLLLLATVAGLAIFFPLLVAAALRGGSARRQRELRLLAFVGPNVICYAFSRGVHLQFLLWVAYSLPYLLMGAAGVSGPAALVAMVVVDWAHSWVANVWRPPLGLEQLGSFTAAELEALPRTEPVPAVRMLGGFYPEGFGARVVPASFALALVLLVIVHGVFGRAYGMGGDEGQATSNRRQTRQSQGLRKQN